MSDQLEYPGPSYRPQRRQGLDPDMKRMGLIAGGIGAALAVVVGGWSLMGRHSQGVPVIEAAAGPIRVKPANPGGMTVVGAGESLGDGQAEALAPPPETPAPQALRAEIHAAAPAPAAPALAAATPAAPQQVPLAQSPPASAESLSTAPAAAPPAPREPAAARREPPTAGGTQVQLAAMASQEAAMAEWERLSRRMPDLLSRRQPEVQRAEHDGRTIFRLRMGGFADMAQATEFCERVRAKGAGCSIASF